MGMKLTFGEATDTDTLSFVLAPLEGSWKDGGSGWTVGLRKDDGSWLHEHFEVTSVGSEGLCGYPMEQVGVTLERGEYAAVSWMQIGEVHVY